jgi:hypothetical protein
MGYEPKFGDVASYQPLDLIAGDFNLLSETIILEAGQNLKRGTVLGRKTDSGKYVMSSRVNGANAEIKDGSEDPSRILAEDVDASKDDHQTIAYLTGSFYPKSLTLGKGHTIASIKEKMELRSIFFQG